jgi:hypothetical protein
MCITQSLGFCVSVSSELHPANPLFGLANRIESGISSDQRQLWAIILVPVRECDLMVSGTALSALEPPAIHQPLCWLC